MSGAVFPLQNEQRNAVAPQDSVWLSASAGTGKTQVLSARVLRLLLEPGIEPSDILCLTFTKAGAAEMAVRVNSVLARWVRLPDADLRDELEHVGAKPTPETRERARTLFASVLDAPGGGLRIDTIHAFAQYLLAAFPEEAGIIPGAKAMEDRDRDLLAEEVLGDLLSEAIAQGDHATTEAIAEMSRRKGPDGVRAWMMRCAGAPELWHGRGAWQPPMRARVHSLLGIPEDAGPAWVAEACGDAQFPVDTMRALMPALEGWNTKAAETIRAFVSHWLSLGPEDRLAEIDGFSQRNCILKKDGDPTVQKGAEKNDPAFGQKQEVIAEAVREVARRQTLVELAAFVAPQLEVGRKFALMWEDAKAREGLVDFDDQIRTAARLLADADMGDWIRYKLDRRFDHILIDEAQDTNQAQWAIIRALTEEFFVGEGAHGNALRTIFTVGDYKQAIFGFQGTSPENFDKARSYYRERLAEWAQHGPSGETRELQDLDLGQSFRTAAPVLDFVDRAIAAIGPERFGLPKKLPQHVGQDRPGLVRLWNTVSDKRGTGDEGSEGWLAKHDRLMADRIAEQVADWMKPGGLGFPLVKGMDGEARRATPGDIMVLVRKRRDLAALIVARLYTHGVPVAGVDRLRLGAPLAVKDLMAALRFAAQPLDDLTLANLLVSPLVGWTQDHLLEHGYRKPKVRLWHHLRDSSDPDVASTVDSLREILRRADFDSPQALLHWMLVGPLDGRRRLVARLGAEANDPIDELLNAAGAYTSSHTASLQGFIRWFDAGDGELKREAGEGADQVRVMTVHGSKGLQAPIVILADATIAPDAPRDLSLAEEVPGNEEPHKVPLPGVTANQRVGRLEEAYEAAAARELEEHWRLLYVAMTRAEEALFIGGSLGPKDVKNGVPHEDSWYARLEDLFEEEPEEDAFFGGHRDWGALTALTPRRAEADDVKLPVLPDWALRPAPTEARPPRPLAPSGLGEVEGSDPPLPPEHSAIAARRGVLIHALLERLPAVELEQREKKARAWLERQAPDLAKVDRDEMLDRVLAVLEEPGFADIFSPDALAEVPLAATVEGQVVAGIADRLLVTPTHVTVVDFKTARRPPQSAQEIPTHTLKQMAAYVAALEAIYPDREVLAGVLYTQTPQLFALDPAILASHKAQFANRQESFALPPVE